LSSGLKPFVVDVTTEHKQMKTNNGINVRDPEFFELLLPNRDSAGGLRTLVTKWDKKNPGTIKSILDALIELRKKDVKLLLLAYFSILVGVCLSVWISFSTHGEVIKSILIIFIISFLASFFICLFRFALNDNLKIESDSVARLQELIGEVESEITETGLEAWDQSHFSTIKDTLIEKLLRRVTEFNLEDNKLQSRPSDEELDEKASKARKRMVRFHRLLADAGIANPSLSLYFDEVKRIDKGESLVGS
jgi:hypothetical protein